jgi:hypothetical protein
MRPRDFIAVFGGLTAGWPLAVGAQPGGPIRLIGVLMAWPESDTRAQSWLAAFRSALAKTGLDGRQQYPYRTSLERR